MLILGRRVGEAVVFGHAHEGRLSVQGVTGELATVHILTPGYEITFTGGRASSVIIPGVDGCDEVKIVILDVEGRQARIGFGLPRSIPVVREELIDRDAEIA